MGARALSLSFDERAASRFSERRTRLVELRVDLGALHILSEDLSLCQCSLDPPFRKHSNREL